MAHNISENIDYLAAKKSIDQRSLNPHVWDELWRHRPDPPLRILELGAGIGTMVERLIEERPFNQAIYTALDLHTVALQVARRRIAKFASRRNFQVKEESEGLHLERSDQELTLSFKVADITQPLPAEVGVNWDLLLANAVLDLVDIPTVLPDLLGLLKPQGLFYFTLTFDGLTHFEPTVDPELDEYVIHLYHRTMDERVRSGKPAGHSRSGRILLNELVQSGATILAAGPSDWIIYPGASGYTKDEELLVNAILDTIEAALTHQGEIDHDDLAFWIDNHRRHLKDQQLIFLAHQLDVCGHPPTSTAGE